MPGVHDGWYAGPTLTAAMTDEAPKSAYELAMERLRRKDAEAGIVSGPLTDDQKARIAEVRSLAEARTAELKILHEAKITGLFDRDARELIEAEHRRDLQRVLDDRDAKIARIREEATRGETG